MRKIVAVNGIVIVHEVQRLYTAGRFARRVFLSVQTEREFADINLSREAAQELIDELQKKLKED